ncbi:MAG TPA: LPS export ABC transporter periplasmic protein LptC [Rhizomicrobium sp.]|jgi:lipopolysaccharide export system protein LptC|nr:LPS export ABC transporter periplasmic protein LptC [Rhizomicrobium sp.]
MSASQTRNGQAVAEPLGRPPMLRATRDWGARARATIRQTERYSRFVTIMKRALPLAAAALLAAVLVYALQPRQESGQRVAMTFQRLGIVNDDLAMMKPRLTGTDDEGDPYVVTAEEAIQDRQDSRRATLRAVEGDVTLKDGTWLTTLAQAGVLDARNRRMVLDGAVSVYSDSGYEIHTTTANVDMRTAVIAGSHAVSGQGPMGTFRADRFRIDRRVRMVFLYGNVHMIIDHKLAKRKLG